MNGSTNAQVNSPDINVENDVIQPITPTSELNNIQVDNESTDIINNWTVVSGNWSMQNGSLHGGSTDNNTISVLKNIVVNPNFPKNLTEISASVKVDKLDTTTANYGSIVYAFIDPNNYKLAGINIYKDAVYAVGYAVTDDNQTAEPYWPGIQTNLTWTPGSIYNLTLALEGSSLNLLINGTEYLTQNVGNGQFDLGDAGLSYGRIQDISFFDVNTVNRTIPESFTTSDTQTVFLEDESLPENSYIHLYDTTPYQIVRGHIAANLPCEENNSTEVVLLAGQAPNLAPIELEYIQDLSSPGELCLYHADINSFESNSITDIAIANNSTDDIDFPATSSVVISVSEISKLE
jgi:hypothetical protein